MSNMSPGPCVISTASERSSGYGGTSFTPKTAMAAEAAQKLFSPEASLGTSGWEDALGLLYHLRTHWLIQNGAALPTKNPMVHSQWCCFTILEATG